MFDIVAAQKRDASVTTLGSRHAARGRRGSVDARTREVRGPSDHDLLMISPSFLELYQESFAPMLKLVVLLTGSEHSAEDLVHDAFIRVHAHWRHIEHPKAYLRRTVVNACRSAARRAQRERATPQPESTAVPFEADELFDVLAKLPHRQRAALILQYYEGLSQAEIADVLGCREGTVASLVHRGLAQLRRVVDRD
jgi:RNA polymerase sigma-70 factor (sigma-E family)